MRAGTTARSPRSTIEASVLTGGAVQSLHRRPADGAWFAAGTPGQPYALRVHNLTGARVEVITSVDGRNTLKDEPADQYANGGFVIAAHGFYDFAGFRLNDGTIGEFVFGTPGRLDCTVAAQAAGSTANVGVLGVAAYREHMHRPPYSAGYLGALGVATASAGGAAMDTVAKGAVHAAPRSIGTEMGAIREDRVSRTSFTRDGEPDILVIGYDTEDALRVMGVIGPPEPNPFPGVGTGYEKYVPAR